MPIKLSRYFKVDSKELKRRGVFNAHLGIDNRLFVDPSLLKAVKITEFKNARNELEAYFNPVIRLLSLSTQKNDVAWKEARERLTFREEHGAALGYAGAGEYGRAIGPVMAELLVGRGKEIVDLGIDASEMFELIGLFQENFGPDLLSDMAISILKPRFLAYTERVTTELNLQPQSGFRFKERVWILPVHPDGKGRLIFVPAALLNDLPVALDISEISEVALFNTEVRAKWNAILAAAGKTKRAVSKKEIREIFLDNPENIADLIRVYRNSAAKGYDFDKDPYGLLSWDSTGRAAAESAPLTIDIQSPQSIDQLRSVVNIIMKQFKKIIEENKLYEMLYREDGKPHHEKFAQLLFYSVADSYCEANNVDLSREPNAGNGPVDFKLSTGYTGRLLVEVKKSNNSDLLKGFEKQLPAYEASEASQESVYLILRVTEGESAIKDVLALRKKRLAEKKRTPEVFVVDARKKPSASKR